MNYKNENNVTIKEITIFRVSISYIYRYRHIYLLLVMEKCNKYILIGLHFYIDILGFKIKQVFYQQNSSYQSVLIHIFNICNKA